VTTQSCSPTTEPVTREDVRQAAARIAGHARRTPVLTTSIDGRPITLKLEYMQVSGSFKFRGALNAVTVAVEAGARQVITASGGNHGAAVAAAARLRGVPALVYVPHGTPDAKVRRIAGAGAQVAEHGQRYAEAEVAARAEAAASGWTYLHAYNAPPVVAGQGTVGLEITEQAPECDVVVAAVGGGGLAAGIAAALDTERILVAVEPENCDALHVAFAHGATADAPAEGVAASALGATRVGDLAFTMLSSRPTGLAHVTDQEILAARDRLWEELRIAVEPAAAAPFAAWLAGRVPGSHPCLVVCGANAAWTPS
jgi:threonine dehydratase